MSDHYKQIKEYTPAVFGSIVRAGLNTAPFTGGIASLWSDWDTSRRFQRVEGAIKEIGTQIAKLPTFDLSRLSDAEMHLLEDALRRVEREHRESKRQLFANLLVSNWVNTTIPFDERLLFQKALDDFEELHIRLLQIIQKAEQEGKDSIHSKDLCEIAFGKDVDAHTKFGVYVPASNKLAAEYGFMRRKADQSAHKRMMGINPDGLVFHVECSLSPLGKAFLSSINLPQR